MCYFYKNYTDFENYFEENKKILTSTALLGTFKDLLYTQF